MLLDIATADPHWGDWSANALADAADTGELAVNPLIYGGFRGFAYIPVRTPCRSPQ